VSAPPFTLLFTDEATEILKDLEQPQYRDKLNKARKGLRLLRDVGPSHPGLNSHRYQSMTGPNGEPLWESYLENQTPSAWRLFWFHAGADTLRILSLGPHP
jgi:hypothetical protein